MKKRALSIFLCVVICISILPTAAFAAGVRDTYFEETLAFDLKGLGLFQGVSETDFDLDRKPSRVEALVMLIRVMGKESEALSGSWKHPFTDVAQWADKYVGYAYSSGLTKGISDTQFGTGTASAEMYLTFVLRALGYSDANGADFTWNDPYALAKSVGILPDCVNTGEFWRSDVVIVSYAALPVALKGTTETLAQKLIKAGAFTEAQYSAYYDAKAIINFGKNENESDKDDFDYVVYNDHVEITDYLGSDPQVSIPATIDGLPVTSIGRSVFEDCVWLTSVRIPDSVISIGDSAFAYCDLLTSVRIPDSVISIGDSAFAYCDLLTSVSIPDSVITIGEGAFFETPWLEDRTEKFVIVGDGVLLKYNGNGGAVSIPYGVKTISSAFEDCESIISVSIPASVTSIGGSAFEDCKSLISVSIPTSITSIGGYAFDDTPWLNSQTEEFVIVGDEVLLDYNGSGGTVSIPHGVKTLSSAFEDCTSLISVRIPDSVTSIGGWAFEYCTSLTGVSIPDSVTRIEEGAFYECTLLTGVSIPDSVTSIGEMAFFACTSLISVSIPSSVTSIGDYAFSGCTSLTSISIPASVTNIGAYAFACCDLLTNVSIPDSVTSIGEGAFGGCTSLTSVIIPVSITSIRRWAFGDCTSLTSVKIPDSVINIRDFAFEDCESLTSVSIPNSVTDIGWGAFDGTPWLSARTEEFVIAADGVLLKYNGSRGAVSIPHGVKMISSAFYGCGSVTSVNIPDSVTSIGNSAFYRCEQLTSVSIPASVTSIGYDAFEDCTSLTAVSIPASVTYIAWGAFKNCTSLTSVNILASVTSICGEVFSYCTSLFSVNIPDSVTSIGNKAFYGCESLTSVNIPDSVTSIRDSAFEDCTSLISVSIPPSVNSIGCGAFERCTSLISIYIPDSVTSIGYDAFSDCDNLTIYCPAGSCAEAYARSEGIPYVTRNV